MPSKTASVILQTNLKKFIIIIILMSENEDNIRVYLRIWPITNQATDNEDQEAINFLLKQQTNI